MIIRTFEIDTEEHARELDELVSKLSYVKPAGKHKKLNVKDVALGIGRPATNEELEEYLNADTDGEDKPLEKVIAEISQKMKQQKDGSDS